MTAAVAAMALRTSMAPREALDPLAVGHPDPATAVLGGGCFWCLEAVFQDLAGVEEVTSGYAGGHDPSPNYRSVCAGTTGHAEVVRIRFLPDVISYATLLDIFFTIHDPTTLNRQGADIGSQYRSIILHEGEAQERTALDIIRAVEAEERWPGAIVTQVAPLGVFHPAEEEHRNYYQRNPQQPYCAVVISPKLAKARTRFGPLFRK